jgi:RHS repeat-associated protein
LRGEWLDSNEILLRRGDRIALRTNGTLKYLLSDHLGSTSITTDVAGTKIAELHYKAWGEVRYTWGGTPTKYTFDGQYDYTPNFGLQYFNARFFDPSIGRFASPDTIIPEKSQGTQAWDRYAFVNNNPLAYTDPTGHWAISWSSLNHTNSTVASFFDSVSLGLDTTALAIDTFVTGVDIAAASIGGSSWCRARTAL